MSDLHEIMQSDITPDPLAGGVASCFLDKRQTEPGQRSALAANNPGGNELAGETLVVRHGDGMTDFDGCVKGGTNLLCCNAFPREAQRPSLINVLG
jgi:hypothetical protein